MRLFRKKAESDELHIPRWSISQLYDNPKRAIKLLVMFISPIIIFSLATLYFDGLGWDNVAIFVLGYVGGDVLASKLLFPLIAPRDAENYFLGVFDHLLLLWIYYFGTKIDFPDGLSEPDCEKLHRYRWFIVGQRQPDWHEYRDAYAAYHIKSISATVLGKPPPSDPPSWPAPRYVRFLRKRDAFHFKLIVR